MEYRPVICEKPWPDLNGAKLSPLSLQERVGVRWFKQAKALFYLAPLTLALSLEERVLILNLAPFGSDFSF